MHLAFPLASAILYVVAATFLKEAARANVGVWRAAFVCNWVSALLFLALWPLGGQILSGPRLWEPAVVALLFVAGQLLTFLSLQHGEVSITTPVLGTKVVLVAAFTTWLLKEPIPGALWAAALLSVAGILLLNKTRATRKARGNSVAILIALKAAVAYALFDVLVMKWAPAWGPGRFLPIMVLMSATLSLVFIPFFRAPLAQIAPAGRRPLALGACFIALQGLILIFALARFGDATALNVVYSSRGLWSVLAAWVLARYCKSGAFAIAPEDVRFRLMGALCLTAAMILAFL